MYAVCAYWRLFRLFFGPVLIMLPPCINRTVKVKHELKQGLKISLFIAALAPCDFGSVPSAGLYRPTATFFVEVMSIKVIKIEDLANGRIQMFKVTTWKEKCPFRSNLFLFCGAPTVREWLFSGDFSFFPWIAQARHLPEFATEKGSSNKWYR